MITAPTASRRPVRAVSIDGVSSLTSAIRELSLTLGYDISSTPGGSDTLAIEPGKKVGSHKVDLLISMAFHGAGLRIAVSCDATDFHRKSLQDDLQDVAFDRDMRRAGITPLHFTPSEIASYPGLCADQILNLVTDFQTGRILAVAAGAV